jgi:hypothetical protein
VNIFSFNPIDALVGLIVIACFGLFFGFLIGLLRYIIFGTLEGTSASRGG